MVDPAGFPGSATVKIYDAPYEGATSNGRFTSSPITFTLQVSDYDESGFEHQVSHRETYGGNFITISNGRSDIELSFNIRVLNNDELWQEVSQIRDGLTVSDFFGADSDKFWIEIDFIGLQRTIKYTNMAILDFVESAEVDDLLEASVTFVAPAYDPVNEQWNKYED